MERDNLMHGARTALNQNSDMRDWCENFLKEKERATNGEMSDEEFEKHWRYHRPEIMHAGAAEAVQAYKMRNEK
jgi:cyclopropane fatty-acyl-phospholipid synthase-like methyltransferase